MPHPYDEIVGHFRAAFEAMSAAGLRDAVAKGGVGEILLAHHMNHQLSISDKGADGVGPDGAKFEYKVSITDQFNFHFGTRETKDPPEQKIRRHFAGISGALCAKRDGGRFVLVVLVPSNALVEVLTEHFARTAGKQLNKNFRIADLLKLPGAIALPAA